MKKLNFFFLVIVLLTVLAGGYFIYMLSTKIDHINKQVEHLDEEVDEAATGIKRLLNHDLGAKSQGGDQNTSNDTGETTKVTASSREFDFGRIGKKDGTVSTTFKITNEGPGQLKIGTITTSCSCTSAKIDQDITPPGQDATLTVTFDPDFHEEPQDRFSRSIFVPTNDPDNGEIEFKIFVDIIE